MCCWTNPEKQVVQLGLLGHPKSIRASVRSVIKLIAEHQRGVHWSSRDEWRADREAVRHTAFSQLEHDYIKST